MEYHMTSTDISDGAFWVKRSFSPWATNSQMAAPEAAFKDVPEIFEVCFLYSHFYFCEHRTG